MTLRNCLGAVVLGVLPALPQDEALLPAGAEGPLANDAFLPTGPDGTDPGEELARGDRALEEARRAEAAGDRSRLLVEAFEAWRGALATSGAGASAWDPTTSVPRRRTVGLRVALEARLRALPAAERAVWRGRFEETAALELGAAAGGPASGDTLGGLASVEALFPGTTPAARAALRRADLAFEAGDTSAARAWLARARAAVALLDPGEAAPLVAGLERREPLLAPDAAARTEPVWERATGFAPGADLELPEGRLRRRSSARPPQGGGVRPGLCVLGPGDGGATRVAVQTSNALDLVDVAPDGGLELVAVLAPGLVLDGRVPDLDERSVARPPGWPLVPACADGDVFLVFGRPLRTEESNALVALRPPEPGALSLLEDTRRPTLKWALVGATLVHGDGSEEPVPELLDLVGLELQPGPVVAGELVCVQAREYGGDVRSWLLALDRATGELRWSRLVASGADLVPRSGAGWTGARLAAAPLTAFDGLLFAPTGLGVGALVEALDGRPRWSLRNRRRTPDERGWPADPALASGDVILWAPSDSDRVYQLDRSGAGPVRSRPIGESHALLGGDRDTLLVQGRAGGERTVSIRGAPGSDRLDALYLGPREEFAGRGLGGRRRVLACSDRGVYLFDRERELYLLDYASLPNVPRNGGGGSLHVVGEVLLALGRDRLWSLVLRTGGEGPAPGGER